MVSTGSSGAGFDDLLELAAIVETQNEPVLGKTLDGTNLEDLVDQLAQEA